MIPIENGENILVGVISFVASAMGENANNPPSRERRMQHCQIAVSFLFEAVSGDRPSIHKLVDAILDGPSQIVTIDSV